MDLEINIYSHYHLYLIVEDIKNLQKLEVFYRVEAGLKVAALHRLFLLNVYESY